MNAIPTLLVADDDRVARELLVEALGREGYRVRVAAGDVPDVDDVGLSVELPAPYALGDLSSAERLPRMAQQVFEHGELTRRQRNRLRTPRDCTCGEVH